MKLIYKLLDFFRGNKRKKPIKTTTPVYNNREKTLKEYAEAHKFARAIRKEKEIGIHPKYRNRQSRYTEQDVKNWETLEKEWEKNNV